MTLLEYYQAHKEHIDNPYHLDWWDFVAPEIKIEWDELSAHARTAVFLTALVAESISHE